MPSDRITRFAETSTGRAVGLSVNGIRVLVTPDGREQQDAADALAAAIANLGPAAAPPAPPQPTVVEPLPERSPIPEPFRVGERVWCHVVGARRYYDVVEVGAGRNHGRIKISGERAWCPASNFERRPEPR